MRRLPPPTSFAEGQRALFGALMAAGGVFYGLAAMGVVLILWLGGWDKATQPQRITAITLIAIGFIAGSIATTIALAIGGPVGKFKGSIGKEGGSFEAEGDIPAATVTTTTAVTTPAPKEPEQ